MLPLGEFTVMIPEPDATLQGAVTWQNQCHDRATLHGIVIPSTILKVVFCHIFKIFFNAVWALTGGGFCIVSDNRSGQVLGGVSKIFSEGHPGGAGPEM